MNIGEANQVNTLLLHIVADGTGDPPTDDEVLEAAAALADRAYAALHAGVDGRDIRHLWADLHDDADDVDGPPVETLHATGGRL